MKTTYPKYRVSSWIDTSPESFAKPEADIYYGVQTMRAPRARWLHAARDGKALFFKTPEEAEKACAQLRSNPQVTHVRAQP
jgi:hypothetical protein